MRALACGQGVEQASLSFYLEEATFQVYTPPFLNLFPPCGQAKTTAGKGCRQAQSNVAPGKARLAPKGTVGSSRDGGHSVTEEGTAHRRWVGLSSLASSARSILA